MDFPKIQKFRYFEKERLFFLETKKIINYYFTTKNSFVAEITFKEKLSDHRPSFKYEQHKNKSKVSSCIWETKIKKQNFEIKWSVIKTKIGS